MFKLVIPVLQTKVTISSWILNERNKLTQYCFCFCFLEQPIRIVLEFFNRRLTVESLYSESWYHSSMSPSLPIALDYVWLLYLIFRYLCIFCSLVCSCVKESLSSLPRNVSICKTSYNGRQYTGQLAIFLIRCHDLSSYHY